jgi:hypothetical protein
VSNDDPEEIEEFETPIPKPDELLALGNITAEMFAILRTWFDVPPRVTLDLIDVDSAVTELGDPVMIVALAMRKLQALNLLATPGVRTTTDVVVTIVSDLDRALLQAPVMRLRLAAEATDWDAELEWLEGEEAAVDEAPTAPTETDPEAAHFRVLHAKLHEAAEAVVEATGGEIRVLE